MKKTRLFLFAVMCLTFLSGNICQAVDVYVCTYQGLEVYVDTSSVHGYRAGGQMMVQNIKFVSEGKKRHWAMGKFIRNGIWYGNLYIDGSPGNYGYPICDYPIEEDALTYSIFKVAYKYLP